MKRALDRRFAPVAAAAAALSLLAAAGGGFLLPAAAVTPEPEWARRLADSHFNAVCRNQIVFRPDGGLAALAGGVRIEAAGCRRDLPDGARAGGGVTGCFARVTAADHATYLTAFTVAPAVDPAEAALAVDGWTARPLAAAAQRDLLRRWGLLPAGEPSAAPPL